MGNEWVKLTGTNVSASKQYMFVKSRADYDMAELVCKVEGGKLLTIESDLELGAIGAHLSHNAGNTKIYAVPWYIKTLELHRKLLQKGVFDVLWLVFIPLWLCSIVVSYSLGKSSPPDRL